MNDTLWRIPSIDELKTLDLSGEFWSFESDEELSTFTKTYNFDLREEDSQSFISESARAIFVKTVDSKLIFSKPTTQKVNLGFLTDLVWELETDRTGLVTLEMLNREVK